MLFFLKIFLNASLYPNDTSEKDQSHRRQNNKVVGNVAESVEDVDTEECTASKEFTEESDDQEDHAISESVENTVKE